MAPSENARPARWTSLSASAGLWLVTALALLRLPAAPPVDPGLDPSWRLCLGYLLQHGMQFGSQVVFTFGPLGFAVFGVYPGSGFWLQMGAAAAVAGMLAWMLLATVRPMHWGWKAAAVLSFLLLIAPHLQALHFLSAALLGLLLLREEKKPGLRNIAACSAALGFLSAMKFPNLMLAAGCVGVAAGYYLFVSNWRRAAAIAGGFVLAFLAWWTVCGQSPLEIPSYCINSLHVTSGYGGAMAVYTKAPDWIGPLTMLILLTYGVFETAAARWQARSVAMAFIFLGTTYLAWRHATVRADISHSLGLYLWTSAIVALNPAFFPAQPRWRPFKIAFLAALAACAVVGIYQIEFDVIARCAPVFAEKMRENAAAVANLPAFESDLNARYSSVARQNAAPRIVDTVKNDSVDVLGFEQSIAILNRLNYRPRPIFQSYVAYAPKLEEMNAAYLAGPHAPDWVLQRYESINHHYPGSEDALALRTLLDRYTYQFQDSGYILWRRTGDQALVALPPPARQGDSAMNRKIQLGDLAGKDLWLEVDYSYSLLGSLRQLFFKPPHRQARNRNLCRSGLAAKVSFPPPHGTKRDAAEPLPGRRIRFPQIRHRPGRAESAIVRDQVRPRRFEISETQLSLPPPRPARPI